MRARIDTARFRKLRRRAARVGRRPAAQFAPSVCRDCDEGIRPRQQDAGHSHVRDAAGSASPMTFPLCTPRPRPSECRACAFVAPPSLPRLAPAAGRGTMLTALVRCAQRQPARGRARGPAGWDARRRVCGLGARQPRGAAQDGAQHRMVRGKGPCTGAREHARRLKPRAPQESILQEFPEDGGACRERAPGPRASGTAHSAPTHRPSLVAALPHGRSHTSCTNSRGSFTARTSRWRPSPTCGQSRTTRRWVRRAGRLVLPAWGALTAWPHPPSPADALTEAIHNDIAVAEQFLDDSTRTEAEAAMVVAAS